MDLLCAFVQYLQSHISNVCIWFIPLYVCVMLLACVCVGMCMCVVIVHRHIQYSSAKTELISQTSFLILSLFWLVGDLFPRQQWEDTVCSVCVCGWLSASTATLLFLIFYLFATHLLFCLESTLGTSVLESNFTTCIIVQNRAHSFFLLALLFLQLSYIIEITLLKW